VSDQDAKNSELVEIVKRNGDFRKNYGLVVGAILYLRSISAARRSYSWWKGLLVAATCVITLLQRYGWPTSSIPG
jgi:TRAP-type uncharacterized transport system fused permease subunit